jgi:pyruvate dehydrogenase E1 component alpha subunit
MNLDERDKIASTHRGHGHCIAKGCDPNAMMHEIYGRADGLCGGKGGSMHIADLDQGMMGANGIVGGGGPLICGAALTAKTLGTGGVAVVFYGDGASNQGTILESYNLARIWDLPVIFAVEDNGYAESTGADYAVGGSQTGRAAGFGIPALEVDGHDLFAVQEAAREVIDRARNGGGPSMLHIHWDRYYGHFEGDAMTYRPKGEVEKVRAEKDCLDLFRKRVTEASLLEVAQLDQVDTDVQAEIDDAIGSAKIAPGPDKAALLSDVYVSY